MLVEATRELMVAVDDLTGNQVDRQWRAGEHRSDDVRISSWLHYVDPARIEELRSLSAERFDLTKLIRLCEELNACYVQGCFFAVAMLTRAIIDHVPPVFGYRTFVEVANNYGSRTFKKSMHNLQTSLRNVADSHLHLPIRRRESLPTRVQVDFSSDLDVLLAEVVRILK
jgi:hypothetical protein